MSFPLQAPSEEQVVAAQGRVEALSKEVVPTLSTGGMGALLRARAGVGGRPGGPRDTHWTV